MSNLKEKATNTSEDDSLNKVDAFPDYDQISHGELLSLSLSTNTTPMTHGMHRFAAKYIPQVPRWAIDQFCTENSVILDPFMGSGTTLVEGLTVAKCTYGLDIDPLAKLIAKSKTSKYDITILSLISEDLISNKGSSIPGDELPMSGVRNPSHWFNKRNKDSLNFIYQYIESIDQEDIYKEFFRCVFSSTLRRVSNADDQSQKTYVSGTLKKTPPNVWDVFVKFMKKSLKGVSELDGCRGVKSRAIVLDGDALSIPLDNEAVDLIVTSPPYVDSVDYMYNFMLEYFWLGPILGVDSRGKFNDMRRLSVGTKNPLEKGLLPPLPIKDMVDASQIPLYRKAAVINYFYSMEKHFQEASRVLKPGGRYVLVVGNSQSANGVMPIHDCLTKLATENGLKLEKAFAYRIRRHYMKFPRKGRGGIILMDWVITLVKSEASSAYEGSSLPIPNITMSDGGVAH